MTTAQGKICFRVAGLEVLLRSQHSGDAAALKGDYRRYVCSETQPDLILDLTRTANFSIGRKPGPAHPGFEHRQIDAQTLALARWDAEGSVHLPHAPLDPVRANFRLSDNANSAEAVIRACMSIALPLRGCLILHASAIQNGRGDALIFAGHSGAGKSTIANLLQASPWQCPAVSDELLIVSRGAGGTKSGQDGGKSQWRAHVTPFIGSDRLEHGATYPVGAIHFLEQSAAHERARLSHGVALTELMKNVLAYVSDVSTARAVLKLATELTAGVAAYRLRFANDAGVGGVLDITC